MIGLRVSFKVPGSTSGECMPGIVEDKINKVMIDDRGNGHVFHCYVVRSTQDYSVHVVRPEAIKKAIPDNDK